MRYLKHPHREPFWRDTYRLTQGPHTYTVTFDIRPQSLGGFDFCSFTASVDGTVVGGCCGTLHYVPQLEAAALSHWLRTLVDLDAFLSVRPNDVGYLMVEDTREPSLDLLCEALNLTIQRL